MKDWRRAQITGNRHSRRGAMTWVACLLLLCPLRLGADDWVSFGGTADGTRTTSELLASPLDDSAAGGWTATFAGKEIVASPVASGDLVYVSLTDGTVHALRVSDGVEVWSRSVAAHPANAISATPALAGGRLYVATMERALIALDAATGAVLWSVATGGNTMSSPVVADGVVYVGGGFPDKGLHAYDAAGGTPLWTAEFDSFVFGAPAVSAGRVYVGANDGTFHAVTSGPSGGAPVGSIDLGGMAEFSSPAATATAVYLVSSRLSKRFAAAVPDFSALSWASDFENPTAPPPWSNPACSSIAVRGGTLVFQAGTRPGQGFTLFARSASTGGSLWTASLGGTLAQLGVIPSPILTPNAVLCVTQSSKELRVLQVSNGVDVAGSPYALSGPCAGSPAFANGRVFVCTWNGSVHCFNSPNAPPPAPASGFSPTGGAAAGVASPVLAWDAVVDPNGDMPVAYIVRYDTDGDLIDFTEAAATTATSLAIGPLADNVTVVWAVRARDTFGAASAFSATQTFLVRIPPDPPASFSVSPANGAATLIWGASLSADLDHYELAVRVSGSGPFGAYTNVGTSTSYLWSGLTNNVPYDFSIRAVDATALPSATLEASVIAAPSVTLLLAGGGSTTYASLSAALAVAAAGDTVELLAGDYGTLSTLSLSEGVSLVGAGVRLTRIEGHLTADGAVVRVDSTSALTARLRDLTLRNPGMSVDRPGVVADGGVVALRNVLIVDCTTGLRAESGADVEVVNVTIAAPIEFGVDLLDSQAVIRNSLITGAGQSGIRADSLAAPLATLGYNDVEGSVVSDYDGLSPDAGSITMAVTFLDASVGDYREPTDAPTVDAGDPSDAYSLEPYYNGGRINIGAFGNTADAARTTPTATVDPDGDGILTADELALGADPDLSDTDSDGATDAVEIGADPTAATDSDGDGVPDVIEPTAYEGDASMMGFTVSDTEASAIGLSGLAGTTIVISAPGAALGRVVTAGYATPLENTTPEGGAPSGYTMPYGTLRFNVNTTAGASVTVTVTYQAGIAIAANASYFKFDGAWTTFSGASGLGDGNNAFSLSLTDGGAGDSDGGVTDGVIVDPGGIAVPIPVTSGSSGGGSSSGDAATSGSGAAAAGGGGGSGGGCFVGRLGASPELTVRSSSRQGALLLWLLLSLFLLFFCLYRFALTPARHPCGGGRATSGSGAHDSKDWKSHDRSRGGDATPGRVF